MRLATTLPKDEESARDNHVLACNFAKYSPILTFLSDKFSNKHFLNERIELVYDMELFQPILHYVK